jgi:hypothetical protein
MEYVLGTVLSCFIVVSYFFGRAMLKITIGLKDDAHGINQKLGVFLERSQHTQDSVEGLQMEVKDIYKTQAQMQLALQGKLETSEFLHFKEATEKRFSDIENQDKQYDIVLKQVERHLVNQNYHGKDSTIYNPITLKT